VAVRVRPFNTRERQLESKLVVGMTNNQVTLQPLSGPQGAAAEKNRAHNFTFDHAYWSHDPGDKQFVAQDRVFNDLGHDVVNNAYDGYNVCVFAYGQTGSGKTYTMMGSENDRGLIPRICETIFQRMVEGTSYRVEVSYLEIYNEKVKDLLKKNSAHNLKVREHPSSGPYVEDLSKHLVVEFKEILRLMDQGNDLRTTASTNMNDTSSRSHAIFTITFVQAGYLEGMPHETESKIHLVDLAGSERANSTGATGQRLKEGAHINKSLVTLGSVISALAEAGGKQISKTSGKSGGKHFIPYRDSVLTWLLKDSLGGNSKTIMIATISPAEVNHNETLSTLRYANRAKNIINKPTVNEDPNVKLIRELREEIERMKAIMSGDPVMLAVVQEQLAMKEAKEQKLTEAWNEKWREAAKILQEHNALGLKRTGLGVVLDSDKPHLIGLDEDILSTGITLYQLREGETIIGQAEAEEIPHILLKGPSILAHHCSIVLQDGVATLHPSQGALCLVNAAPVDTPTRLSQGCVIVLGKTNMFRYNDPLEAADLRKTMSEKSRKASLMNQSLLSQSLSDLRNPPGQRYSGEWPRMFASDSDIKDIAECPEIDSGGPSSLVTQSPGLTLAPQGSQESVCTLKQQASNSSTAHNTPRRPQDTREELNLSSEGTETGDNSTASRDINANPRLMSHSTPSHKVVPGVAALPDLVSPVKSESGGEVLGPQGTPSAMLTSSTNSSTSGASSQSNPGLSQLYSEICNQKDIIMQCLEEDNCDIDQLNAEIATLQGMQHKYSIMEFESNRSVWQGGEGREAPQDSSFYGEKFQELIEAEVDRRMELEQSMRGERERRERELLLLEKEQEMERLRVQHEREMYLIKKKLSTAANTSPKQLSVPSPLPKISIPRYFSVGSGKSSYVEYELVVETSEGGVNTSTSTTSSGSSSSSPERWRLYRRYRQFRDLHTNMTNRYGPSVQSLSFPARKLFGSRSDSVSAERQRELQSYLNSLVTAVSKIPSCPLFKDGNSRDALTAFSTFFQTNNGGQSEVRESS